MQNLPGSVTYLIRLTAKQNEIDIVLLDMSPSVGALNQCFLMGSDYFIVPTSPDYYCEQAIRSLARIIPKWNATIASFRNSILTYPFQNPPQFLGTISQRYRPHSGQPAASFQRWIDKIKDTSNSQLVPVLTPINMVIPLAKFKSVNADDSPYNLANISDFNSLIAQSQKHNVPVFALSDEQIEQSGSVLETMKKNREIFLQNFKQLANIVVSLI